MTPSESASCIPARWAYRSPHRRAMAETMSTGPPRGVALRHRLARRSRPARCRHAGGSVRRVRDHRERLPAGRGRGQWRTRCWRPAFADCIWMPTRSRRSGRERIGAAMAAAGVSFVDGGIIGGPAWEPGSTWLYLAGPRAEEIAACFAAGPLETRVLGDGDWPGLGAQNVLCRIFERHHRAAVRYPRRPPKTGCARRFVAAMGARWRRALRRRRPSACGASPRKPGASPARWTRSQQPFGDAGMPRGSTPRRRSSIVA